MRKTGHVDIQGPLPIRKIREGVDSALIGGLRLHMIALRGSEKHTRDRQSIEGDLPAILGSVENGRYREWKKDPATELSSTHVANLLLAFEPDRTRAPERMPCCCRVSDRAA